MVRADSTRGRVRINLSPWHEASCYQSWVSPARRFGRLRTLRCGKVPNNWGFYVEKEVVGPRRGLASVDLRVPLLMGKKKKP